MDISSDSSDTIILSSNVDVDEPSDSEIDNILKKYSSTSTTTSGEFKESTNSESNVHGTTNFTKFTDSILHKKVAKNREENYIRKSTYQSNSYSCDEYNYNLKDYSHDTAHSGEFSDDDLINIPLVKRPKKDGRDDNKKTFTDQMYGSKSDRSKYSLEDYCNDSDENIKSVSENKNGNAEYLDMDSEEILRELNNKYRPSTSKVKNQETDLVVLSDDSDTNEMSRGGFLNRLGTLTELRERRKAENREIDGSAKNSSEDESGPELDNLSPKAAAKLKRQWDLEKRKKYRARERERKHEEAERKKAMRNIEKERKKEEADRQRAMKNALKTVEQSTKPDECMKHMIIELCPEVLEKDYGGILKASLANNDISFKSVPQALPKLVSWHRKVQSIEDMVLKNTEVNEKHFLLVMDKLEFLGNIRRDSLTVYLQSISSLTKFKMLTIAILGIDKVTADQDLAIVETQLLFKCYFRFVKDYKELSMLLLELTKAIAQIPHKAKKEEKYKLQAEYFNDSNKDTVRVDKNGNGLGRLWQQMLTMFPLARLETAEAITAVYPTPDSLFKAYDGCPKKEELLQDLPIRRALGPCISIRRIGPELSRKCSTFFCSTDNVMI